MVSGVSPCATVAANEGVRAPSSFKPNRGTRSHREVGVDLVDRLRFGSIEQLAVEVEGGRDAAVPHPCLKPFGVDAGVDTGVCPAIR
jgi:hypothetical protein